MFDPYDTQAVTNFLTKHVQAVQQNASDASSVAKMLRNIDSRVQRRRDAKQLLKMSAASLADAGWTRHDITSSNVRWGKMLKRHGASDLVRTLKLTLHDATEMGLTAPQLLGMTSDLLSEWQVKAPDMIALGATVPQLLDRYETCENLMDMGFTRDIMVQMGMKPDAASALFNSTVSDMSDHSADVVSHVQHKQEASVPNQRASLETVNITNSTSFDF